MDVSDLIGLELRIARGEDLHTEFKREEVQSGSIADMLVAFANTEGGWLLIGVADDGSVPGVRSSAEVSLRVDHIALNNCRPPIAVRTNPVQFDDGKVVVVVDVPRGENRPYRTNRGVVFVRTSSGKRAATTEELRRMLQSSGYLYHDETIVERSSVVDLDSQAIQGLVDSALVAGIDVGDLSADTLLDNWRLTSDSELGRRPTVSGVLFLARKPQQYIPHAYVSALRIPGDHISGDPSDQKRIVGRVGEVVEDTMRFIRIHLPNPHKIVGIKPETEGDIPSAAIREILVNSVAHRDYTIASPIRVIVFDDRVQVRTPGFLPNTVTVESLRTGVHVLRNPTIYNMLLKLGLVTDAGSGIPRAIRLVREAIGAEPRFFMENQEFVVDLPRKKHN